MMAQYEGVAPDDPRLEPYWSLAEQLDVPVAIHMGPGEPAQPYGTGGYRAALGNPLLLEEVLVRHPRLRLYIMHAGYPMAEALRALMFSHPQVYVDVGSIVYTEPRPAFYRFLQEIVEAGYGDRIMFGSDQMIWPGIIAPGDPDDRGSPVPDRRPEARHPLQQRGALPASQPGRDCAPSCDVTACGGEGDSHWRRSLFPPRHWRRRA